MTGDNPVLPTDDVLQIGLVVNELFTNACKYAFAGRAEGTIAVAIHADGEHTELRVADDGVGVADGVDLVRDGHLGMTIVRSIVEQLEGTLSLEVCNGTCFRIGFPKRGDCDAADRSGPEETGGTKKTAVPASSNRSEGTCYSSAG